MINPILQTEGPGDNSRNNMRNTGYNRGTSGTKKIILIMIIVLIVLIVVGGGVFAYTYFFTDAFLNEEQGFYKYITQNSQILEMFNDEDLNKYMEKIQSEPYAGNGEMSIALSGDIDEESKKIIDEIQKHKITFNSSVDNANKYSYNELVLKYGETNVISGAFVQQNDYLGLKVNDIGLNPYIVLENNNLKQFAKNLGLSDEKNASIPDKIDFEKLTNEELFTKEELEGIKERYLKAITDNLTEDMFSQKEENGMKVYTLTINKEKGKVLISALMSTLKDDDLVLNKFKQLYIEQLSATEEEAQALVDSLKTSLEEAINELNGNSENTGISSNLNSIQTSDTLLPETKKESEKIYINVYVSNRNLVKTEVFIENGGKFIINNSGNKASIEIVAAENEDTGTTYKTTGIFSIEKNKTDNELTYIFSATAIDEGKNKEMFKVNVSYTGLKEMTNVGSSILFDIYNYPNDSIIAAAQKAKIESERSAEKQKISIALNELIAKSYEDTYVSETEFEINETTMKQYMDKQGLDMTVSRNEDGTYRLLSNTTGNIYTVDSQWKITNTEYAETANTDEEEKIIIASLNLKGNTTFGEVQQQDLSNKYLVNDKSLKELESLFTQLGQRVGNKFKSIYNNTVFSQMIEDYNKGGVLTPPVYNAATDAINSTSSSLSKQEKSMFNSNFIQFEGASVSGPQVNALIIAVIASNESEINGTQRYIKITFPSINGNNQEINVKDGRVTYSDSNASNKVTTGKQYKVSLKYDDNGIVNEITVKEK